jgi:hypothetical protein
MNYKKGISQLLIFSFVVFSVLHQLSGKKDDLVLLRVAQVIGSFSLLWFFSIVNVRRFFNSMSFRILIVAIISAFTVNFLRGEFYILNTIYALSFFAIANLITYSDVSDKFFIFFSVSVFLWLGYLAISGLPPSEWLKGSRNHVSILAIYLVILTQLIRLRKCGTASIITHFVLPFCALVLSTAAIGRSGIITSGILFITSLFWLLHTSKYRIYKFIMLFAVVGGVGFYVFQNIQVGDDYLYKFETKGFDLAEREDVIANYINNISFLEFFIGPVDRDNLYDDITLHNSYLHWHLSYGFGSIIIVLMIFGFISRVMRKYPWIAFTLIIILLRSFSDQILLSDGILMGLPLFLIFQWDDLAKTSSN